jgi:aryl-alcohol dehydrogenase-like predicted oxidoreductase
MGILPYFPLASGLLTGKYRRDAPLPAGSRLAKNPRTAASFITERNWRLLAALEAFASTRGRSLTELAFAWLLRERAVASVIAGATSPEQVDENVRAAAWTPTAEEIAEMDRITA